MDNWLNSLFYLGCKCSTYFSLKFGHGWAIASHIKQWMQFLIRPLNSMLDQLIFGSKRDPWKQLHIAGEWQELCMWIEIYRRRTCIVYAFGGFVLVNYTTGFHCTLMLTLVSVILPQENLETQLHFLNFLNTVKARVVEILLHQGAWILLHQRRTNMISVMEDIGPFIQQRQYHGFWWCPRYVRSRGVSNRNIDPFI